MSRASLLGIVATLVAAAVIGCGGSDDGEGRLLTTTGLSAGASATGTGTATGGATTGTPGETFTAEVADAEFAFSGAEGANARLTPIGDPDETSGVGFTQDGSYLFLARTESDDLVRELRFDVPLEFEVGRTYKYAPPSGATSVVAAYTERVDGNSAREWRVESGTASVVARTGDEATLAFEDLLFRPAPGEENAATGTFLASGTVRVRFVPAD